MLSGLRTGPATFAGAMDFINKSKAAIGAAFVTPFNMRLNLINAGLAARANQTIMMARGRAQASAAAVMGAEKMAHYRKIHSWAKRMKGMGKFILQTAGKKSFNAGTDLRFLKNW
jgi:hypothetical protein